MADDEVKNRQWVFNDISKKTVELDIFGVPLRVGQDNKSMHVGTTVWDSSMVLAKYLERNWRMGEFSKDKLAGKHVIELGAGCGIAGIAMAIMGCNVLLTDIPAVLPILKKNVKRNMGAAIAAHESSISISSAGKAGAKTRRPKERGVKSGGGGVEKGKLADSPVWSTPPGKAKVQQLWWGKADQIEAVKPPFEYIVATDVVYLDDIVEPLLSTMVALMDEQTIVLFGYEIRSATAHALFWPRCHELFHVSKIPHEDMDSQFQDEAIDIFVLRKRSGISAATASPTSAEHVGGGEHQDRQQMQNDAECRDSLVESLTCIAIEESAKVPD